MLSPETIKILNENIGGNILKLVLAMIVLISHQKAWQKM